MANDFYNKNESYEIPTTSNYFKFQEGDNRFRILGAFSEGTAVQGLLYWTTIDNKRKPIRLAKRTDGTFPTVPVSELETNKFGEIDIPKFFWAMPVWNYAEKKIQILEITQKTILKYIKKVIENTKWGDPREYDFIVNKGKEGEKTVYTVTNDPKEKLEDAIVNQYIATPITITNLFSGDDPFVDNATQIADAAEKAGL
jgi:hypothetical protein